MTEFQFWDAGQRGFALHKLKKAAEEKALLECNVGMLQDEVGVVVAVTFSTCPEYWEDLWDLQPHILLVNAQRHRSYRRSYSSPGRRQLPSCTSQALESYGY
jgi:hypothetical protein